MKIEQATTASLSHLDRFQHRFTSRSRAMAQAWQTAFLILGFLALAAPFAVAQWAQLPIHGGGFVTGMVASDDGTLYCRTDVGGAYRWTGNAWTQLIVSSAFPNNPEIITPGDNLTGELVYNVESVAVDRYWSANVWLATGDPAFYGGGYLLHSTDSGATWNKANLTGIPMGGNSDYRENGERLAIDPANSNVVYFGSRTQGLYYSTNANDAANNYWSVQSAVDAGSTPGGGAVRVNIVVFDPNRGTNSNAGYTRSNTIYAASALRGI